MNCNYLTAPYLRTFNIKNEGMVSDASEVWLISQRTKCHKAHSSCISASDRLKIYLSVSPRNHISIHLCSQFDCSQSGLCTMLITRGFHKGAHLITQTGICCLIYRM